GDGAKSRDYCVIAFIASHQGVVESFELPHLDVVNAATDVAVDDSATNNTGAIDPGETVDLTITLTNPWRSAGKGIASATAVLSSPTPGVTIPDDSATYGPIAAQGSGAGDTFTVSVAPSVVCGSTLEFTLTTPSGP